MELMAKTCSYERMNIQRLAARLFVLAGGIFWAAAAFGASFSYNGESLTESMGSAVLPLAIAGIALVIGWFYEVLAAALLFAGSVGVLVWGLMVSWEAGVWLLMGSVLLAPMLIAGLLFLAAARMQTVCTLEEESASV